MLTGAQFRCVVQSIWAGLSDERLVELVVIEDDGPAPGETLLGNLTGDEVDLMIASLHECLDWGDLLALSFAVSLAAEGVHMSDESSDCVSEVAKIDAVESRLVEIVRDLLADPAADPAGWEPLYDAVLEGCWVGLAKDFFG